MSTTKQKKVVKLNYNQSFSFPSESTIIISKILGKGFIKEKRKR